MKTQTLTGSRKLYWLMLAGKQVYKPQVSKGHYINALVGRGKHHAEEFDSTRMEPASCAATFGITFGNGQVIGGYNAKRK